MKKCRFNKSVSANENQIFKIPVKEKQKSKKPISIKYPSAFNLNDILDSNYNNYNSNINFSKRFYYKNPQFLNSSNIQNQINILLTNINNYKNTNNNQPIMTKNESCNSLKKLPKIKTFTNFEKSENTSVDSPSNNRYKSQNSHTNISINNFPNISNSDKGSYFDFYNKNTKDVNYIYKSIFTNSPLFKEKIKFIDNKLNIVYCQNEKQYKFIMEKRNKLLNGKGTVLKFEEDSEKIKGRVNDIKTKIKFMKNIMDYSYPSFMLTKIKTLAKNRFKQKLDSTTSPVNERKNQIKKRNIMRSNYLKQNFIIFPLKI